MTSSETENHPDHIDYAERRRTRATQRSNERWSKVPWAVLVTVLAVVVTLGAVEVAATSGRIHQGVSVAGVKLGGMVPSKARIVVEERLAERVAGPVIVVSDEESWTVTAADIGLTFDYDASIAQAMAVGRDGGAFKALSDRVVSWVTGVDLDAQPEADPTLLTAFMDKVAKGTDVAAKNATVDVDGTDLSVVSSKPGTALQRPLLTNQILRAFLGEDRRVQAPVAVDEVDVTDAEAAEALKVAEQMISEPVELTYKDKSWEFTPKQIAGWLEFVRSDAASGAAPAQSAVPGPDTKGVTLVATVSPKKASKLVTGKVGADLGRAAKDASFKTDNGAVTIVPSQTGVGPDLEKLAVDLDAVLKNPNADRTVVLETAVSQPEITTEDARAMGIRGRISKYTTTYSPSNRPRVNNIHRLGDALDGTLVAPGETFSFNGSVGERTAAKGYQEAPAIVNGTLVPQLGGGICQVGTTIFNAVFRSGLPVVERRNHSFYISHYPAGRDATVSWGGPDFKFKNTTDHWVLIAVSYTSGSITIALYGTDPGYEVEAEVGEWRNVKDFPVKEIKDDTVAKGKKIIEDPGEKGRTITVKRIVSKDGKVVRTDTFTSVYRPKTETVRVGTKKVPSNETSKTAGN